MKTGFPVTLIACLGMPLCWAQHAVRMPDPLATLTPFEHRALKQQAAGFYAAASPAVGAAAASTVRVSHRDRSLAYGTVVAIPGGSEVGILTKWSEVRNVAAQLTVTTGAGQLLQAAVSGVYADHDLALLELAGSTEKLTPITLANQAPPALGDFVMLASPYGDVESLGVVSVKARSLRDGDKAFLGIHMDFATKKRDGVQIDRIVPGSAAHRAGLREGDVIVSVDKTPVNGAMEMRSRLQRLKPGAKIVISYLRADARRQTAVRLGSLESEASVRRIPRERMQIMQRMGAIPSRVRSDFPSVIQSDMPIHPSDAGAPVADLDGNTVGIAIARGSRIKTFIIPAGTIRKVLRTPPLPVQEALAVENGPKVPDRQRAGTKAPRPGEDPMDRVRRLLREGGR